MSISGIRGADCIQCPQSNEGNHSEQKQARKGNKNASQTPGEVMILSLHRVALVAPTYHVKHFVLLVMWMKKQETIE